jgi:hypothetical protein
MSIQTAMKHFDDSLDEAVGNKAEAEKAVIHWTEVVRKLTEAKSALSLILSPEDIAAAPAKGTKPAAKKAAAKSGVAVPKTDAAFWNGLLTTEPQGTKDILELACKKLNVTDPEAVKTIQARQTAYLQTAAKEGLIKSEGERLQRKYFV